jgi:hypothetical protein
MKDRDPLYHVSIVLLAAGVAILIVRWLIGVPA